MKTIAMTMRSIALLAMMTTAMMASAATTPNGKAGNHPTAIISGRGHTTTVMAPPPPPMRHEVRPCNCRDCKKIQKMVEKHMRKHHTGKHNKMTCRTCMEYSHMLNAAHQKPQPHHHHR